MAKFPSPLLGYNNNVRHKGRVFHIQTEDSGINHPHIITHLFMDGGRILKSVKTSYAQHVGVEGMGDKVRTLMKDQHKAMVIALRDGQYDEVAFVKRTASSPESKAVLVPPASPEVFAAAESISSLLAAESAPDVAPASERLLVHAPDSASAIPASTPNVTAKTELAMPAQNARASEPPKTARDASPRALDAEGRVEEHDPSRAVDGSLAARDVDVSLAASLIAGIGIPAIDEELRRPLLAPCDPRTRPEAGRQTTSASELTLDFDALENYATTPSPVFQPGDLPPPPKTLSGTSKKELGTGSYRAVVPQPASVPPDPPPPSSRRDPGAAKPRPVPPEPRRYAPARPATGFAEVVEKTQAGSIFGDDLVGDKSLDEVILSYLAEDLDPPRRK